MRGVDVVPSECISRLLINGRGAFLIHFLFSITFKFSWRIRWVILATKRLPLIFSFLLSGFSTEEEWMWMQVNAFHSNGHVQVFVTNTVDQFKQRGIDSRLAQTAQIVRYRLGTDLVAIPVLVFLNESIACSARPCCVSPPPPLCYHTLENSHTRHAHHHHRHVISPHLKILVRGLNAQRSTLQTNWSRSRITVWIWLDFGMVMLMMMMQEEEEVLDFVKKSFKIQGEAWRR